MSTRLIIIRHAEAAGNKERFFQGSIDGKVSDKGYRQLDALAERMKDVHFDAIYASPLSRAQETAMAANRCAKLPLVTDERLIEIDGGVWEGLRWGDIPKKYPIQGILWVKYPYLFSPRGGEKMTHVYKRISEAALDLAAKNDGKTIVLVSHGCAIRNLLCFAKGLPITKLNDVEWCDHTAVSVIDVDNGAMTLISENDSSHLTGELSTLAGQRWWRSKGKPVFDD